ncbi:MAG: flavin reductase family protein [Gammaproteobacteria bacterium]|nr:flavin reductase family protein [Gammaproteobacteria bacterium]
MAKADAGKSMDALDLRRAFGAFATGVTIVTTADQNGEVYGFTANSFTSVSLDPPLLLVNIAKSAYGLQIFTEASGFAINILAQSQRDLSNTFASRGADKFANIGWNVRATGSPLFEGVIAWFDCEIFRQVDAGDHVILIGRVLDYEYNSDSPLAFCRGAYVSFGLSPSMLQMVASRGKLRVGALIEDDDRILLETDVDTGEVRLPVADSVDDSDTANSLIGLLSEVGIEAHLPFIYAAYHHDNTRYVYYRGGLRSPGSLQENPHLHFVGFDQIPWQAIRDSAITTMLKRFINEHSIDNYAVYIGGLDSGEVYPLKIED